MSLTNQVIEQFSNAAGVAVPRGAIVRATTGPQQATLAQADTLPHLMGLLGTANNPTGIGGPFNVVVAGRGVILLEAGLTPAVGDDVFVSATVAGRGTNVAPTLVATIAVITDISTYAATNLVGVKLSVLGLRASSFGPTQAEGFEIHDPFISSIETSADVDSLYFFPFGFTSSGTAEESTGEHQGQLRVYLNGGGGTPTRGIRSRALTPSITIPSANVGRWTWDWVIKVNEASDASHDFVWFVGASADVVTVPQLNRVAICYNHAINGGRFFLRCTAAGTTTDVDTGVTFVPGTWYYFRIVATQSLVQVYIDTVRGTRTLRAENDDNIPTVNMFLNVMYEYGAFVGGAYSFNADDFLGKFEYV